MNRRNFLTTIGLAAVLRKLPIKTEKAPPQINVGEPLTATEILRRFDDYNRKIIKVYICEPFLFGIGTMQ